MTEDSPAVVAQRTKPKISGERLPWVDYARGLAILLVVYRHTMVGLERSGLQVSSFLFNIQEVLVNVRMPVFFVLSGIFLSRSLRHRSPKTIIGSKARNVLYPYVVWAIILITMQIVFSKYTNSSRSVTDYKYILFQPRELDHLWYLLALFNTSVLMTAAYQLLKNKPGLHLALAFGFHFVHYWVAQYSLLSDISYFYVFLCLGVCISDLIMRYDTKGNSFLWKGFLVITPFFVIGQYFWFTHINHRYEPLEGWYLIPFLFITIVACAEFYFVCRLLFATGRLKLLSLIGRSSLYIYILHILVISIIRVFFIRVMGVQNAYVIIALSLLFGILLPVMVFFLAKRWKPVNYLFSLDRPQVK